MKHVSDSTELIEDKMTVKINIIYGFVEGPWGGGNQFLKALRDHLIKIGVYSERPEDADVILFNSHHMLDDVISVKRQYPEKIMIHRVDGPIFYTRGRDMEVDREIFRINDMLADGTVFQSKWSKEKNYRLGISESDYHTVIMNAPDGSIFNSNGKVPSSGGKTRIIATSWSDNLRKGFDIYQYLDEHLDFNRFDMTFVGNSPVGFKNIKWIRPVPDREIARLLKEHDIYVTASRNDPCSNSLIEALHSGLPAVAASDGGHPEIVGEAGELFDGSEDVIEAIEKVAEGYDHYRSKISMPAMDMIANRYYSFAQKIYDDTVNGKYVPKRLAWSALAAYRLGIAKKSLKDRIRSLHAKR